MCFEVKNMKRKNGEGTWGFKTIKGVKYVFHRNSNGKYFYGKTEKEVWDKIERQKRIDAMASSVNDVVGKPSMIFYKYCINYVESIKMTLQPYTYYNYTHMINNFLERSSIGRKQLHQLTPDMFSRWYSTLAEEYSYGTIRSIHKILKGPLNAAEDEGLVKLNTQKKIKLPMERYCKPLKDLYIPDLDEMKMIEELCYRKNKHGNYKLGNNGLAYIFILHTGLRLGELIALRWNDVDTKNHRIDINKSASFRVINGKQVYEDKAPKSKAGFRKIPYDNTVETILSYLKENYPPELDSVNGHVFTNSRHSHMCKSTLEECLRKNIANKYNMPRLTPHTLRHGYSSFLASKKVNPKVIAKLMGHERVNFTFDVYVDSYEDDMIEAANLLNELGSNAE